MSALDERKERLWVPVAAPAIWATHFTFVYITVAVSCGGTAADAAGSGLQMWIAIYTAIATLGMAGFFVYGYRRHRRQLPVKPHDDDTPEDRRGFLAFMTMLLAGLSLLATVYVTIAVAIVDRCQ